VLSQYVRYKKFCFVIPHSFIRDLIFDVILLHFFFRLLKSGDDILKLKNFDTLIQSGF
jgi:hypothetical protein